MSDLLHEQKILILDFGSQYTQNIARKVRECAVYCEIHPCTIPMEKISEHNTKGIILSGGPASVLDPDSPLCNSKLFDLGIPVLGICYGMQLITHLLDGQVNPSEQREFGRAELKLKEPSSLFEGVKNNSIVWMSHGDRIDTMPNDWQVTSYSQNGIISSIENHTYNIFGVQFHPEVVHTHQGNNIIKNFILNICQTKQDWSSKNFINETIKNIRSTVGNGKVLCALSGGVDSTVVSTIMKKAIGNNAICVFIDHGLLRKNEAIEVVEMFNESLDLGVNLFDRSKTFLSKLENIQDPEKKRKIIGLQFIEEFQKITLEFGKVDFLAQGTLYPDIIESGGYGGSAKTIKSHHNVGGLPEKMNLTLIEPVKELFKDEVRKIGKDLDIPNQFISRHPFPGPGLGIRILGEITEDRLKVLREADALFIDILKETNEYDNIWQAFCVLLPIRTVGVMGDNRTYDYVIGLRMVTSLDGMTADWYNLPEHILKICSSRIVNEVKGVNRVVLDITSKPPGTIEWE